MRVHHVIIEEMATQKTLTIDLQIVVVVVMITSVISLCRE